MYIKQTFTRIFTYSATTIATHVVRLRVRLLNLSPFERLESRSSATVDGTTHVRKTKKHTHSREHYICNNGIVINLRVRCECKMYLARGVGYVVYICIYSHQIQGILYLQKTTMRNTMRAVIAYTNTHLDGHTRLAPRPTRSL